MNVYIKLCFTGFLGLMVMPCSAQTNILGQNISGNRVTRTAPLFLLIPPDARACGMGDAGAASSPDVYSNYWNPAKLAFSRDTFGIAGSYMPWLRQLLPEINFSCLQGFLKLNHRQTLGCSIRYFSLGTTYINAGIGTSFNPYEYAVDFSYARRLSNRLSVAMSARYIYSNLTGAISVQGVYTQPGRSVGIDISSYYQSKNIETAGKRSTISAGICISNIGPKISYSNTMEGYFLPTNLKLGGAYTLELDKFNTLTLLFDANKLLVPTPPIISNNKILIGMDPNVSPLQGMLQSFYDAPGGFKEEVAEITVSPGIEYEYENRFAFRSGFFYENKTKGGRQYVTLGAGFKFSVISIDAAYLIPITEQSPLQNTFIISLSFQFPQSGHRQWSPVF